MNLKNLNLIDISFTKLAVFSATLFLISIWPKFASWATATHWGWFLGACLIFSIKPIIKVFG